MTAPTAAQMAEVLGVRVEEPRGDITMRAGMFSVGLLVIRPDGTVLAVPRRGLTESGMSRLIAKASHAAIIGRGQCRAWRDVPDIGLVATVYSWQWPGATVDPSVNDSALGGGQ